MLRPISGVFWGCDPEGFFSKDGVIVGSEKVIPRLGIKGGSIKPHVVRDGVQFELNPPTRNAVNILGREITIAFDLLSRQLKKVGNNIAIDWRGLVEVGKDELASLSADTRLLGCNPSKNFYEEWEITVDPETYPFRSAGGHLHFGITSFYGLFKQRDQLVPLLDILVGNTLTMIDRDPGAKQRRENYGRAGEYRTPDHGLEYRVPSNFWLRNYSLMSLTFGLANIAISILKDQLSGGQIQAELAGMVDITKIIEAINTSNAELARANFERMRPFLAEHLPTTGFPIAPESLDRFLTFAGAIQTQGLSSLFPQDPVAHWLSGTQVEFSQFLTTIY